MTDIIFTFKQYKELLERLLREGYSFEKFSNTVPKNTVLLRHDIDWSPRKAVRFAQIEADLGITSTYFFLVSSPFYNVLNQQERQQISQIQDLGHNIGLHFSTHQYFDSEPTGKDGQAPPDDELVAAVDQERKILELVINQPIDIVSFHNPPEWTFQKSYNHFTSTYEARFFDKIVYRADSNQRWRGELPFTETIPSKVQLLTHPVLWGENDGSSVDRLREERDYHAERILRHIERTDNSWIGQFGLGVGPGVGTHE
jgi:hypothetical protein